MPYTGPIAIENVGTRLMISHDFLICIYKKIIDSD